MYHPPGRVDSWRSGTTPIAKGRDPCNTISMNKGKEMTSYTSPFTGTTYGIVKSYSERGAWDANGDYAPITVKQYSIYDGDKMVQFAFDEATIANAVRHYEQPCWDGIQGSSFD